MGRRLFGSFCRFIVFIRFAVVLIIFIGITHHLSSFMRSLSVTNWSVSLNPTLYYTELIIRLLMHLARRFNYNFTMQYYSFRSAFAGRNLLSLILFAVCNCVIVVQRPSLVGNVGYTCLKMSCLVPSASFRFRIFFYSCLSTK